MSTDRRYGELVAYIEACDAMRGLVPDSARASRMAAVLRSFVDLGERLGPWPNVKPAGPDSDPRL